MKTLTTLLLILFAQISLANDKVDFIENDSASSAAGAIHRFGQFIKKDVEDKDICMLHQDVVTSATLVYFDQVTDRPCGDISTGYSAYIPHFIPKNTIGDRLFTKGQCTSELAIPLKKEISKTELINKYKANELFDYSETSKALTSANNINETKNIKYTHEIGSYYFKDSSTTLIKLEIKADSRTIKTTLLKVNNSNLDEIIAIDQYSNYSYIGSSENLEIFFVVNGIVYIVIESSGERGESNHKLYFYKKPSLQLLKEIRGKIC